MLSGIVNRGHPSNRSFYLNHKKDFMDWYLKWLIEYLDPFIVDFENTFRYYQSI